MIRHPFKSALAALIVIAAGVAYAGTETFTGKYIDDLREDWPLAGDPVSAGANHIRGIKLVLQNQFTALSGPVNADETELNYLSFSGGYAVGTAEASKVVVLDANKDFDFGLGDIDATLITGTTITASTGFTGNLTGNVTGDLTGNASTASYASTTQVTNSTTDTLTYPYLAADNTDTSQKLYTDAGLTYNADTNVLAAQVALASGSTATTYAATNDSTLVATTAFVQDVEDAIPRWRYITTWDTVGVGQILGSYTAIPSTATGIRLLFFDVDVSGTTDDLAIIMGTSSGYGVNVITEGSCSYDGANSTQIPVGQTWLDTGDEAYVTCVILSGDTHGHIEMYKDNDSVSNWTVGGILQGGTTAQFRSAGRIYASTASRLTRIKLEITDGTNTFASGSRVELWIKY